jgi:hypothetical protein
MAGPVRASKRLPSRQSTQTLASGGAAQSRRSASTPRCAVHAPAAMTAPIRSCQAPARPSNTRTDGALFVVMTPMAVLPAALPMFRAGSSSSSAITTSRAVRSRSPAAGDCAGSGLRQRRYRDGEPLTPRHGFRIASHSKSFTAAGILRLVEAGQAAPRRQGRQLRARPPPRQSQPSTLAQLLSNSAGLTRDGPDNGQFFDRKPYCDKAELLADLALPPVLPASQRFKYSNHGFGLLGLVIEAVTARAMPTGSQGRSSRPPGSPRPMPDIDLWSPAPDGQGAQPSHAARASRRHARRQSLAMP